MKLLLSVAMLLALACAASAQGGAGADRCKVYYLDMVADRGEDLGSFDAAVALDKETTRVFRLPGTPLSVTATVLYESEDPYASKGIGRVVAALNVARKAAASGIEGLDNAVAEVPAVSFGSIRVSKNVLGKGGLLVVILECKRSAVRQ